MPCHFPAVTGRHGWNASTADLAGVEPMNTAQSAGGLPQKSAAIPQGAGNRTRAPCLGVAATSTVAWQVAALPQSLVPPPRRACTVPPNAATTDDIRPHASMDVPHA